MPARQVVRLAARGGGKQETRVDQVNERTRKAAIRNLGGGAEKENIRVRTRSLMVLRRRGRGEGKMEGTLLQGHGKRDRKRKLCSHLRERRKGRSRVNQIPWRRRRRGREAVGSPRGRGGKQKVIWHCTKSRPGEKQVHSGLGEKDRSVKILVRR